VARAAGVATAAFFSQPCAVDIIYGELWAGRMALPATDGRELVARGALSVELGPEDMPPFVAAPEFEGLNQADDVLVNSFRDFEPARLLLLISLARGTRFRALHDACMH
jgi:hypothetical protein